MAVGVSEVEAPAARFPLAFLFHCDLFFSQERLPVGQFSGWNGKRKVRFAIPIVWR